MAGGQTAAFLAFAVAALTMILLLFALSLAIGTAQARVMQPLRASTQQIKRWGGFILVLVGSFLVALAIFPRLFTPLFP